MENSKDIRLLVLNVLKEGRLNIDEADRILNYISQSEIKENTSTNTNSSKSSFSYPSSEAISDFAKDGVSKIEKFVSGLGINFEKVAHNIGNKINSKMESSNQTNHGVQTGEKFTFTEEEIITFSPSLKKITLENNWGGIKIVGQDTENIKLLVEKIIWTKSQDLADEKNKGLKVSNSQNEDNLQFLMPSSSNEMTDTINIELIIPKHLSLELSTISGDVVVQNIYNNEGQVYVKNTSGDTEVKQTKVKNTEVLSVSGDLTFKELESQLNVRTTSGVIELEGVIHDDSRVTTISGNIKGLLTVTDRIELSSSSGNIDIKQHKNHECKMVDMMSHSGDIHYHGVIHNTLRARTNSGDIKGRGIVANDARIEVTSNSGDINWGVDEDCSLSFRCENKNGDIFTNLLPENVTKTNNDVSGTIKDGLAKLSLSTVNGDLKFHKESVEVKV